MRSLRHGPAGQPPRGGTAADTPARDWHAGGTYFTWQSPLPENRGREVKVFHVSAGDPRNPAILLVHGFPTSSYDFRPLIDALKQDFHVHALDFPGYGMSDKPGAPYRYTLAQDAQLIWDFVTKIVPLQEFVLFSHDRGDSVALNFLQMYQAEAAPPFRITHQVLTNANLYLPLANLTDFQKTMLDPAASAAAVRNVTPERLAAGLGATQYTPPLAPDDPEVRALAYAFAWQQGTQVIPATIQYLAERRQFELGFLDALAKSDVPATLIWGAHDMVSPLRVANHVWATCLKPRAAAASYWLVPCANHYLVHDQGDGVAAILRRELSDEAVAAPANLGATPCAPVLVDRH